MGGFASLALVLSLLGVYGLLASTATGRRREIGIRMAVGARRRDVIRLLVRQGMAPVAVGLLLGLGLAGASHRVLESLLFGIGSTDPSTYLGGAIAFAVVAAGACWLPARRASRLDPTTVLRDG